MIGNKTGKLGEDIATLFLKGKGYVILHQNYWKPYGEIDIVCKKADKLHFIEVKAVLRSLDQFVYPKQASETLNNVSHENIRPEDNVHSYKLKKLGWVIEVFLSENRFKNVDWQFDVCIVEIDKENKKARVEVLENQILEVRN